MTTHVASPHSAFDSGGRPGGPVRSVTRLHRGGLWVWVGYLAVTAGVLLWLYGPGGSAAEQDSIYCSHHQCYDFGAIGAYKDMLIVVDVLIRAVAFLAPAYVAALLVGRELQHGTHRLAWTQGVSPARWMAARLAVPAVAVTVGTGVLVALFHLVRSAEFGVGNWGFFDSNVYYDGGLLAFVYPLLGVALGALAGLLLGRSVPAALVAVAAMAAVQLLMQALRFKLLPTETRTSSGTYDVPSGAELQGVDEANVHHITAHFHPASHVWPLQFIESGIVLAAAALAVAGTFQLLRNRAG